METQGWTVLRFWNNDVYGNIEGVLESILDTCEASKRALEIERSMKDETT